LLFFDPLGFLVDFGYLTVALDIAPSVRVPYGRIKDRGNESGVFGLFVIGVLVTTEATDEPIQDTTNHILNYVFGDHKRSAAHLFFRWVKPAVQGWEPFYDTFSLWQEMNLLNERLFISGCYTVGSNQQRGFVGASRQNHVKTYFKQYIR
jgi:hypothetical protein